jgi:hypothetical protein
MKPCTQCRTELTAAAHGVCPACINAFVSDTTAAQGLPRHLEDADVVARVAGMMRPIPKAAS